MVLLFPNKNIFKKHREKYLVLLMYLIVIILHHCFGYIGHYGYDDLHYAEISTNLLNGSINFDDHYSYRFPVILLTSLFYSIFGISDLTSSLPALLLTFSTVVIVFSILRNTGLKSLIFGLSLTAFSDWFLFYSDKLMPDIYVAFSVISVLAVIHRYKYESKRTSNTALFLSILLAFCLLFGFMAKGTIVLLVPLLLYFIVVDIAYKRDLKFWKYSILSGLVVFVLYFITIWLLTGDFFKRFEAIANNNYLNLCSYDKQSIVILLKRISYEFFKLSINQKFITGFVFAVAILFRKKALNLFKLDNSFSFFLVSSVILLLSSNFMTISLTSYSPMCLDPRHYLFLIPVVSIPASSIIVQYLENNTNAFQISIGLAIIAIISFFLDIDTLWKLYFPLFVLFTIYSLLPGRTKYQTLFTMCFVAILFLMPLEMVKYAQKVQYRTQKDIIYDYVLDQEDDDCIIITNNAQKRFLNYYSAFNENNRLRFMDYKEFEYDSTNTQRKILLLNFYTRYLSGMDINEIPYYARNIPSTNTLLFENKELNISIYEMNEFSLPEISELTLLKTINDFEGIIPNWNQAEISTEISYAGEKSNKVSEYSATFQYPVDSLDLSNSNGLLIRCNLYCYFEDETDSKLVVSIADDSGAYVWKAMALNKYIKAYSNWWPVEFEISIDHRELRKDSYLGIYLWNMSRDEAYIDNFEIKFLQIRN